METLDDTKLLVNAPWQEKDASIPILFMDYVGTLGVRSFVPAGKPARIIGPAAVGWWGKDRVVVVPIEVDGVNGWVNAIHLPETEESHD